MRKITIPLKNVRGKDKFGKILTESVHRGHDKQGGAFIYWQYNAIQNYAVWQKIYKRNAISLSCLLFRIMQHMVAYKPNLPL